jgi:hypothetical protein
MNEFDSQKFMLNSVNILLQTIGELPIEDEADIDAILEARIARDVIIEAKQNVLSEGWDLNTDTDYPLYPDENNYIVIPTNILDLSIPDTAIVVRDWQLFNKETSSRKFTTSVSATIRWNLDFNSLPYVFRNYITIMASRLFQGRLIGDKQAYAFTQNDEQQALLRVKQSEGFTGQYNMLSSDYGTSFNVLG